MYRAEGCFHEESDLCSDNKTKKQESDLVVNSINSIKSHPSLVFKIKSVVFFIFRGPPRAVLFYRRGKVTKEGAFKRRGGSRGAVRGGSRGAARGARGSEIPG